ncbi:MAG: ABC transporter permease [Longimicrobiales bacterium]
MNRLRDHQLYQLTLMRFRDFAREPEAMFWTFFFPIIMALALGIAFRSKGPETVHVGVLAGNGADSAAAALTRAGIDARVLAQDVGSSELRRGRVALVVIPNSGGYTYKFDASRPESRVARMVTDNALQGAAGRTDPRVAREDLIEERGSRYIDFLIPGLIGLNLLSTGLWGVGYAVVRMRNEKLLKRFMTTPVRRSYFLLSFILGRLIFLAAEIALVLGFATLVFSVPVRGSLLTLGLVSVLGAITFTGLGLLIASRTSSIEGVQGYMNVVQVPMWILSGVFFSADNFPAVMQPVIRLLPLTALNDALRSNILDGAGIADLAPKLAVLIAWGLLSFLAALRIFRWR